MFASIATLSVMPAPAKAEILPSGTYLEVRLSLASGSSISRSGDAMEAIVVAPVFKEGRLLIPQGTIVSGVVKRVERVGLGLKHVTSAMEYRFDTVRVSAGTSIPIQARVVEVETAKERVNTQGVIGGIDPTANLSSIVAFYTLPLLCMNPEVGVPVWGVKLVIARSPDPEIYFPPGTELILRLTAELDVPGPGVMPDVLAQLSASDVADVHRILAELSQQWTDKRNNHPSDLLNIVFLGSRESISRAFQAAGWSVAQGHSPMSVYRIYHSMVQRIGYSTAPMGHLTLNGVTADAEYQKSLNTFSKRHHLRLWKSRREDAWLSAATEDVGYAVRQMRLTHATDPLIDNERAKVLNDLTFTGCVAAAALTTRDFSDPADQQEHAIVTDGEIAIVRMNDCRSPRRMLSEAVNSGAHGRRRSLQALVAARNDIIRTNPISFVFHTIKLLHERRVPQADGFASAFQSNERKHYSSESSVQPRWIRPSVLDATSNANNPQP